MKIKTRLTLQYIGVVALIFLFCFAITYVLLSGNRKSEFYTRLINKGRTTADLLLNVPGIDSAKLRRIDRTQKDSFNSKFIKIYDLEGRTIYTNRDFPIPFLTDSLVKRVIQNEFIKFQYPPYDAVGFIFTGKNRTVAILTGAIDTGTEEKNKFLFQLFIYLYLLSITIVSIAGWIFARKALNPLGQLMTHIRNLPVGSLDARLPVENRSDEIALLTNTFNNLLDKIQSTFRLQRMFLSAASHEMKNPLTKVTSQLQVLENRDRDVSEYRKTIRSVLDDLMELNKSTNDLIEFARLSNETNFEIELQAVRIDEILWTCKEYFNRLHPEKEIRIQLLNLPENPDHLIFSVNKRLLEIAITNLIDNAAKFSSDKPVEIQLSFQKRDAVISVIDHGIGMEPSEQMHIFEPFYRVDNTSGIMGHGLGLAIVQKVARVHGIRIHVISEKGQGTVISLVIPAKF